MKICDLIVLYFFILLVSCTKPSTDTPEQPKQEKPATPFLKTDSATYSTFKPHWALDSIKVTSNVSWKAVLEPFKTGIQLKDSVGHGNGYITFWIIDINRYDTTYSASLYIMSDSAATVHMQLKQPSTPNPYFFCSAMLLQNHVEGFADLIDSMFVFSNSKWIVSRKPSWLSITPSSGNKTSGRQTIYLTTTEMNTADTARYGEITVSLLDSSHIDTGWGPPSGTVVIRQKGYGWIKSLRSSIVMEGDSLKIGVIPFESNTYCRIGEINVPGVAAVNYYGSKGKDYHQIYIKIPNRTGHDLAGTVTLEYMGTPVDFLRTDDNDKWAKPITIPVIVKPAKN